MQPHSISPYLLSAQLPGTAVSTGNTAVGKTDSCCCPHGSQSWKATPTKSQMCLETLLREKPHVHGDADRSADWWTSSSTAHPSLESSFPLSSIVVIPSPFPTNPNTYCCLFEGCQDKICEPQQVDILEDWLCEETADKKQTTAWITLSQEPPKAMLASQIFID